MKWEESHKKEPNKIGTKSKPSYQYDLAKGVANRR